jgi:hypothetical protein
MGANLSLMPWIRNQSEFQRFPGLTKFSFFLISSMGGREDDLPFRVELWDDKDLRVEEMIAIAGDFFTASCAYEEAVKRRPGKRITLRQKARVIKKS